MPFDGNASLKKIYGSLDLAKVKDNEDGTITVFGVASSETRDAVGEVVSADAMKGALPDYSKYPALREMHQPMAAGKVLEAEVDDDGVTHISALVVDPVAIVKVRTGVYSGFSIGGKVTKRDPTDRTIITGLRLVEISLVDSPCNPDAALTMWKADLMFIPHRDEVVARAKDLAKAAGTPKRYSDFLFDAKEELVAEKMLAEGVENLTAPSEVETVEEPTAKADEGETPTTEEAPAATVEEPTAEAKEAVTPGPDEDDHAGDNAEEPAATAETPKEAAQEVETTEEASDPATAFNAALAAATDAATKATTAETTEATVTDPFADLDAVGKALKALTLGKADAEAEGDLVVPATVQKSMYDVSRFADLLCSLASVQRSLAYDAEYEGDASPIPAELAEEVKNLSGILVRMAQEEVAELVASLVGSPEVVIVVEEFALANQIVDAVKANGTLVAETTERLAKRAPVADPEAAPAEDVEKLREENDRLTKALAEATPAVEAITAKFTEALDAQKVEIEELRKRFEEEPLPPKTAGPAVVRTITKAADAEGGASGGGNDAEQISTAEFRKAFDELGEEQKGQILLKIALANPKLISAAQHRG